MISVCNIVLGFESAQVGLTIKKWFDQNFGDNCIELSYKWARESDRRSLLLLHEDRVILSPSTRDPFIELVNRLRSKGIPLDLIGLQEHHESAWLSPLDICEGLT